MRILKTSYLDSHEVFPLQGVDGIVAFKIVFPLLLSFRGRNKGILTQSSLLAEIEKQDPTKRVKNRCPSPWKIGCCRERSIDKSSLFSRHLLDEWPRPLWDFRHRFPIMQCRFYSTRYVRLAERKNCAFCTMQGNTWFATLYQKIVQELGP